MNELRFRDSSPQVRCIVVENEADGAAPEVCQAIAPSFRFDLEWHAEPRRGIPQARNAALAHAAGRSDFVAFIDDDEVPDPDWLDELLRAQRRYGADVVAGPVLPRYDEGTPAWVRSGRHFDHPRYRTGQRLPSAATGNVLISARVLESMEEHFDEGKALCGGEDIHFFDRVNRAGFKIVWADQAVVEEWVPLSRASAKRILRRCYRYGTNRSSQVLEFGPTVWKCPWAMAIGCGYVVAGLGSLPWGLVGGRSRLVWSLRYLLYGLGVFGGLLGGSYDEYRTTDGQ